MTRSVRIMCFTIGLLLIASAVAVAALPVANFWPWSLLFASAGIGLFVGAYVAMEDADSTAEATAPDSGA